MGWFQKHFSVVLLLSALQETDCLAKFLLEFMDHTSFHSFEFLVQRWKGSAFINEMDDLKICMSRLEKVNSGVIKPLKVATAGS
jgi:hypothetical protein